MHILSDTVTTIHGTLYNAIYRPIARIFGIPWEYFDILPLIDPHDIPLSIGQTVHLLDDTVPHPIIRKLHMNFLCRRIARIIGNDFRNLARGIPDIGQALTFVPNQLANGIIEVISTVLVRKIVDLRAYLTDTIIHIGQLVGLVRVGKVIMIEQVIHQLAIILIPL